MRKYKTIALRIICLFVLGFGSGCSSKFIENGCKSHETSILKDNKSQEFQVLVVNKCNPSGVILEKGAYYKFEVTAFDLADGRMKNLGPDGFNSKDLNIFAKLVLAIGRPFRPMPASDVNWFELIGTIGQTNKSFFSIYKHIKDNSSFQADNTGELYSLVNDFPTRYWNNEGSFKIRVTRVSGKK